MIGQVNDGWFGGASHVVDDEFIVRRELVGYDGGQFAGIPLLAVGAGVL